MTLDSSTVVEDTEALTGTAASENDISSDVSSEPSTDTGSTESTSTESDVKPKSLLELAEEALKETNGGDPSSQGKETKTETEAEVKAETKTDATNTDADVPFHKHPRWQQVISENKALKEKAQVVDQLVNFAKANHMEVQDLDAGAQLVALVRTNPAKALEVIAPLYQHLAAKSGAVLPNDLKDRVDKGFVDQATAEELARARAQTQWNDEQARLRAQRDAEANHAQTAVQIQQGVNDWETRQRATDPDFEAKAKPIERTIKALLFEKGQPRNQAEAIALADEAKKIVEAEFKRLNFNSKPAIKPTTGGGTNKNLTTEPKSLMEAAMLGLRMAHG